MQHMGEVESGDFTGRIPVTGNDELSDLTERFNQMSAELDTYTKQVYLSKIKQTEAELNALKSQIYPHFLYNTLEVIRMTAVGRNDPMVAETDRSSERPDTAMSSARSTTLCRWGVRWIF